MTYALLADMIDRFGEREVIALTDRENIGEIDESVLEKKLISADTEINAYLAGHYSLPLATVPPIVRDYACDIARYRLCTGDVVLTEEIRTSYEDAMKFFNKVASGLISLGLDSNSQTPAMIGTVKVSTGERVFNQDTLRDY